MASAIVENGVSNSVVANQSWERKVENKVDPAGTGVGTSGDGYLRRVTSASKDLNTQGNGNGKVTQQGQPGVSVLAGKYLLIQETPSATRKVGTSSSKVEVTCVNIQTKEQYTCKIVPRCPKGLTMLAAYHRLGLEGSEDEYVNQVVEAILTPKVVYLILPKSYGNVHSYLLDKRTLDEPEAANIFKQMVQIVEHCHSKGVILRDIKMGRFVFVDKHRHKIKLESLEDATLLVDPCNDQLDDKHGCPNYVSPEKAETLRTNKRYPGKASDVWCLGVILYTMLSGRYPFNDPNQGKLLNKIRAGNFIIPPGLSASVTFLIKCLLRKLPSDRPSCKEIVRSPWLAKHCVSDPPLILEEEQISKEACEIVQEASQKNSRRVSDQVVPDF